MYEEFLKAILAYVQALNAVEKDIPADAAYLANVPVCMDHELVGFLVDEVGGVWSYRDADDDDRAWWADRPMKGRPSAAAT